MGPRFGAGVFAPFRDRVEARGVVPGSPFPGFVGVRRRLERLADGDLLLALKPRYPSFGVALRVARRRGVPVVLDVDDEETALFSPGEPGRLRGLVSLRNPNGRMWTRRVAGLVGEAAAITAGSPSLARRYGATYVPYAVDTRHLDPARFSGEEERRRLGFPGRFLVVFCGTPRPHKGLDLLARVVGVLDLPALHLLVVGADPDGGLARRLREFGRGRVTIRPPIPRRAVARHLAAASAVVVPQRDTPYGRMQLPAKLVDAMAMGRRIVAARVGDIPDVLDGGGFLFGSGDACSLARALRRAACCDAEARKRAVRAREICRTRHDLAVVRDRLEGVLQAVLEGARSRSGPAAASRRAPAGAPAG